MLSHKSFLLILAVALSAHAAPIPIPATPRALSLSADGAGDVFAALVASPPDWMFSWAWDAARLTVRGVDEAGEGVSVRLGADPWMLILR